MVEARPLVLSDLTNFIINFNLPLHGAVIPLGETGYFDQRLPGVIAPVFGYDNHGRIGVYVPVITSHPEREDADTFFTIFQRYSGDTKIFVAAEDTPTLRGGQKTLDDLRIVEKLLEGGTVTDESGTTYKLPRRVS
jgi:hypothetical protein